MNYEFKIWSIQDLVDVYNSQKLNLNPPYQRNDIWPPLSKKRLIESIKKGFPLPTFFLHVKEDEKYEMIDGQQRTRTFLGYQKGFFSDTDKLFYNNSNGSELYNSYKINVCLVKIEEDETGVIEDFYYRVNKYGLKINRPEMKRAGFAQTEFQELTEKLAKEQSFVQLAIFSEKTLERLNDLDFVSELLVLITKGITDKKITVDRVYENQETIDFVHLENRFNEIIQKITDLDAISPIPKTRYRQRNDFYTLFSYLQFNGNEVPDDILIYQYKLLVLIGEDIYPTNEKCWAFQEYATNCVSQSNSKRAREERLQFFNLVLLNKEPNPLVRISEESPSEFDTIADIVNFYNLKDKPLKAVGEYFLIDIEQLSELKTEIIF
jgi:hypothetical protein